MESNIVFERVTEVLKHEHRMIEKVLAALETFTESPGEIPLQAWRKAIDFIRNFADKCHHLKEEKILFPTLERHGIPREGGPIGIMLAEHEVGRRYVVLMAAALAHAEEDPEDAKLTLVENARAYLGLLREHIWKEEEILFGMADEALASGEQRELLREFEQYEAQQMGPGVHDQYLKVAEELQGHVN